MKHRSREACESNLKKIFSNTESDTITVKEACLVWGRDPSNEEENKRWFSTLLTHLKYQNLVKPVYAMNNSRRTLNGIKLTIEGRKVLGRDEYVDDEGNKQNGAGAKAPGEFDITKQVTEWKKSHPEWGVKLKLWLKDSINPKDLVESK